MAVVRGRRDGGMPHVCLPSVCRTRSEKGDVNDVTGGWAGGMPTEHEQAMTVLVARNVPRLRAASKPERPARHLRAALTAF